MAMSIARRYPLRFLFILCLFSFVSLLPFASERASATDKEWPPAPDAYSHRTDPALSVAPDPALQIPGIVISFPSEVTTLLDHLHNQGNWNYFPIGFAVGDVDGRDDGDLQLVIRITYHALIVGDLDIDWTAGTGTFNLRWIWEDPRLDTKHIAHADSVVIWDMDGDLQNEIVIIADVDVAYPVTDKHEVAVFRTIPGQNAGELVAFGEDRTDCRDSHGVWLNVCNLSGTDTARDLLTYTNHGEPKIWRLNGSSVDLLYSHYCGDDQHALNAYDVDGDGYDEIGYNGVVDFVDVVDNDPVFLVETDPDHIVNTTQAHCLDPHDPENGIYMDGIHRWRVTPPSVDHTDHITMYDFDPDNPGGELMTVPQPSRDKFFDQFGTELYDSSSHPCDHGQSITCGNFAEDERGIEALFVPKGGGCKPPKANVDRLSAYITNQ